MVWNLRSLRDAVQEAHGKVYAGKAWDAMQSLNMKKKMAMFHATEAMRVMQESVLKAPGVGSDDRESIAAGKAIFIATTRGEAGQQVRDAEFCSQAHVVASVQAVHSLCDIVSYVVYWSFRMDGLKKSLAENEVNLHKVKRYLEEAQGYDATVVRIHDLLESHEFHYLADYVNTTKHKVLIKSPLSADLVRDRAGLRIKPFTYTTRNGIVREHEQRWAYDFIVRQNDEVVAKIVGIGESLNEYFFRSMAGGTP